MCGIIITRDSSNHSKIEHRGIEYKSVKRHGFVFGHHRLPIQTSLGDEGSQPVELHDGSLLLFNGEIFNYPKKYKSDIEYLSDLFSNCNIRDVLEYSNKWDGFWAIVFVSPSGMMYCFTDPLGKKQLYYNKRSELCSEIIPIKGDSKIDTLFKSSVYKFGYNTDDLTPFKDVKRIMPNILYVFMVGDLLNTAYKGHFKWEKNLPTGKGLRELLYESVTNRLVSKEYKISSLVSGGLDSSIIALILRDLNADCTYYTVENGETEYAEYLAGYLGIKLNYLEYKIDDTLKDILLANETPIDLGSLIPQHRLFSAINDKIVLSGDGADELFGGYKRINKYDSQMSDIFQELTFYHLPRLDRASMRYTIELRNPFLSHDIVKYAMSIPYKERTNKKILKETFQYDLPKELIYRPKLALKNKALLEDADSYKNLIFDTYYNKLFKI